MSFITLITDFGSHSHYIAILKAKLWSVLPNCKILDINHDITPGDINEALFLLENVRDSFNDNTIHLISVGIYQNQEFKIVTCTLNQQHFFSTDNALLTLLGEGKPNHFYEYETHQFYNTFQSIENFCKSISVFIQDNYSFKEHFTLTENIQRKILSTVFLHNNIIKITVLYVDNFGNLYTNFSMTDFTKYLNNKKFSISLGNNIFINKISNHLSNVRDGEVVAYFATPKHLVIGMRGVGANFSKFFSKKVNDSIMINIG